MILFNSDYLEGAHPKVLHRLNETNMVQTGGYGEDSFCSSAAEKIRAACCAPNAAVHFLVGGTQTNTTVICSILRPHEGVFAAETGHINVHEGNGVESTGHKVLTLPHYQGKIHAEDIESAYLRWKHDGAWEHIVKPGMVYISQPTETGMVYSKAELTAIREICLKYHLPLFVDGARLGYALASEGNDVTLADLAQLCDVFYIGGTKVGALFGEAVVVPDPDFLNGFRSLMKQRGAMLAKGRLLGIQFDTLFSDDLYLQISKHAIAMAMKLRDGFQKKGYAFACESPTNQQFPILSKEQMERLSRDFSFEDFGPVDETHHSCRFCTSWATREEDVDALLSAI